MRALLGACLAAISVVATAGARPAHAAAVDTLLIGDSVMAGMAQGYGSEARATLGSRYSFLLEAAECRRLIAPSCRMGTRPAPANAITVLAARAGSYDRALVVGAGYNDSATGTSGIGAAVDRLVAEARRQGITRIVWLTYREAGDSGHIAHYRASNAVLREKDAQYADLYLADWAARSRAMPAGWFSGDGLHLGASAATAMADLIGDTLDSALRGVPVPPAAPLAPSAGTSPAPGPAPAAPPPPLPPTRCTQTAVSGELASNAQAAADAAPPGGVHVLDPPVRLLDTRELPGSLEGGRIVTVPVAGLHGVAADAVAAVVTITSVEPCADGFVTAFPCGNGVPTTAVLNAPARSIVANSAVVRLGRGAMCVYANRRTDVVVDITGWIGPGGAATAFSTPARIVDTRAGEQQILPVAQQRLAARSVLAVDVATLPQVGATATAVTFNLAAAEPSAPGFLTVLPGPCATVALPPATATLTVTAHRDVAASATVAVRGGQICVYSSVDTDVVIDLQSAHVPEGRPIATVSPQRLIDTRTTARLRPGTVVDLELDALMPGVPPGLTGAVVNVTGVDPATNGYVVIHACNLSERPFVSNLNLSSVTVANRALVSTGGGRRLCMFTTADTDVVIDVEAWIV